MEGLRHAENRPWAAGAKDCQGPGVGPEGRSRLQGNFVATGGHDGVKVQEEISSVKPRANRCRG